MFNLLMSKIEMKNLWKMMVAALVIIGATACTETEESVDANEQACVSFYATFGDDDTRAYIDDSDGDKRWTTVWEEGDVLLVANTADDIDFTFKCTDAATGKFTCEDSKAADLIGQTVLISSDSRKHPRDSRLGKKALYVWTTGVEFTQDATIQLTSQTSFLRYTYEGEGAVTLKLELQSDSGANIKSFRSFDNETEDIIVADEITFSGIKGENFVPFWCGIDPSFIPRDATLSYSIDGVKVKETTINHICCGKVYNLGTLTDPEPAYELSAYSVPGTHNNWTAGETPMYIVGDYCVAFNVEFAADGAFKILGDKWIGANNLTVGKWTATGDSDIYVSAGTYDIYYSEAESKICVVAAGEEVPAMPVFSVGVVGLGGNWDTDTDMTLEGEYYTLKNVTIAATDTFKLRISDAWDENYGIASSETADTVAINVDAMYTLVQDGKNMQVAAGTYDLYFDYETKRFYVLTAGTTPDDLAIPQYKIYVYQFNNSWKTVNLYTWDSTETKYNGDWPGTSTTVTETVNGYEYIVWTMDRAATGVSLNVILNNGTSQTSDFALGQLNKDYYLLLEGSSVSFIEDPTNPEPEVIEGAGEPSEWAIVGAFDTKTTNWIEKQMVTTATPDLFVVENVVVPADYTSFLIKKFGDAEWLVKYGGGITYFNPGNYMTVYVSGTDICLTKAGTYDFYFDLSNTRVYVVEAGADYTTVTEQTVNGEEPKQEEPEVTENMLYLKPNANWKQDNARFAAYFWGNGDKWVSMTDSDNDGIYELHIPEGYDYGCNVIFCRMNPSTTANNWNNKWNQTADLKAPTDGKNLYTVKDNTWDKGGGTWSVK